MPSRIFWGCCCNIYHIPYRLQVKENVWFLKPPECVKFFCLLQVSEKAIDYKIWKALFERELPCTPTYLPDTKLAKWDKYCWGEFISHNCIRCSHNSFNNIEEVQNCNLTGTGNDISWIIEEEENHSLVRKVCSLNALKKILVSGKKKLKNDQATRAFLFLTRDLGDCQKSRGGKNHVISPKVLTQLLWNFHTL